ncbi:hypothetical protein V5O48_012328 [Marasmius crinis-equi]|uniref:Uncharacterized protein n=1 Tax=Marasmius crinis-equi TaxID=585013 RepID=A0ABR3F339_9AGAR
MFYTDRRRLNTSPSLSEFELNRLASTINTHTTWRRELFDVGIFKDTILPSLSLHSSLALIAYAAGRETNSVETKDWLWSIAPVVNGWWSAVGRKVLIDGLPLRRALVLLSRPERLLLTGVTLWGGRLLYRVASRGYHPAIQACAVGLFSTGFALEVLVDWQLARWQASGRGEKRLCKEGVWSQMLLYGSNMLVPVEIFSSIVNYLFLRRIEGDKQTEACQEQRYSHSNREKYEDLRRFHKSHNAVWPKLDVLTSKWFWALVGAGVAGVATEKAINILL